MIPANPALMVYDGTEPLGEIEDRGRNDVRAWLGTGDDRVSLGVYPDRRTAMRSVSAAAKAAKAG
jgi:hypothetical protein